MQICKRKALSCHNWGPLCHISLALLGEKVFNLSQTYCAYIKDYKVSDILATFITRYMPSFKTYTKSHFSGSLA